MLPCAHPDSPIMDVERTVKVAEKTGGKKSSVVHVPTCLWFIVSYRCSHKLMSVSKESSKFLYSMKPDC